MRFLNFSVLLLSICFAFAPLQVASEADFHAIQYQAVYPHGDFYIFTGDLSPTWSRSDFARFFVNARWLSEHGFRVIINPVATIGDLQEAVRNPNTVGVVWNGHGDPEGGLTDARNRELPFNIFNQGRSPRLKYVLFATCHGPEQIAKYAIAAPVKGLGFTGELSSEEFFKYFDSHQSVVDLEEALGVRLEPLTK